MRWIIAVFLLAACGGTPDVIAPTTIPPTTVPLSALDLEPLLIQSGDLPAGIAAAQVKDVAPLAFNGYPPTTKAIDQRFQRDGKAVGGVVVLLYEQQDNFNTARSLAMKISESSKPLDGVGEEAKAFLGSDLLPIRGITFIRCRAIVDVSISNVTIEEVAAYAMRLDKRLSGVVC